MVGKMSFHAFLVLVLVGLGWSDTPGLYADDLAVGFPPAILATAVAAPVAAPVVVTPPAVVVSSVCTGGACSLRQPVRRVVRPVVRRTVRVFRVFRR